MARQSALLSNMPPKTQNVGSPLWRRLLLLATVVLLVAVAVPLAAFWHLGQPTHERPRQVHIPQGASARRIGELLESKNLVHSAHVFALIVRLQGLGHQLEAGTYELDGSRSTAGIVQDLLKAPVQTLRVTITEGLTRHQIAGLLQAENLIDSTRFVAVTEDAHFVQELGLAVDNLEGYLFPETYFFDVETDERAVVKIMVDQFHQVFADSLYRRLPVLDLSLHQAVTLASIVELEAVAAEERPVISGVFQRRLKLNRRLESCATVEYALGVHKKRLTNADLKVQSPFNTYRHRGLPPGPIGNPGRAAILATLYPTDTEYLYFVARGDGTHIFSRTNKEHVHAKQLVRRQERLARLAQTN